jgi:3'-phosphoadenosine 5'-phosphosulfate (PAPS) 3'-phosphatase
VLASATEFRKNLWAAHEGKFDLQPVGGTAYKLARLAVGFGDAYITLDPRNEWDICGGVALVLAAGGRVTDLHGQGLAFNQADTLAKGVVAANPTLHANVLDLLG